MNKKRNHACSLQLAAILWLSTGVLAQAAGNVQAILVNGSAIITGDDLDNNIIVIRECCDRVTVVGRVDTTVNGSASRFDIDGVFHDVLIRMRRGDDFVRVELASGSPGFPGDLKLSAGEGDDIIELLGTVVPGNTTIDSGDGNDLVFIDGVRRPNEYVRPDFQDAFTVQAGSGDDLVEFHNVLFRGVVDVHMGSGIDGVCNTADSHFRRPAEATFAGGPPSDFPGDGLVAPIIGINITGFEFFPDDCVYLGGRH